eukprot:NODE_2740_length_511_cov_89.692708_g2690_i0.p1 GENE.NODE_2740_length_511_cov_89.692708_g2690_i0~~NODE_2740_length_511_cov_89.692708_g2690_i0.p1  ORF type:complete len:165 (+),score=28.97 NODE_2740_length_511_cov_89.692708_g2690_i0:73-495(+)
MHALRLISRAAAPVYRSTLACRAPVVQASLFQSYRFYSAPAESDSQFAARWAQFFNSVQEQTELNRGLENMFAHDICASSDVMEAALRAARRVDSYAMAVRVLEGIREKTPSKDQYQAYMTELKPTLEELGVETLEAMGQ